MDKFIHLNFIKLFNVEKIITLFYKEFTKDFSYEGESHDFWEMVYIDKGEMLCTADTKQFVLKGGEITFHKPNEFHNISSNRQTAPNLSVISFVCKSRAMKYFENKIIPLKAEEKSMLAKIIFEGRQAYELLNDKPPIMGMKHKAQALFGSSQMTKNLLEAFLIELYRSGSAVSKSSRQNFFKGGISVSCEVNEVLEYLEKNIDKKINLNDIALAVNKSVSSAKAIFNEFYKGGIINYFNYLKIQKAKKLIREKDMNFSQIARSLAFDNVHYFSKCFKKVTDMTPTEYKNSIVDI